MLAYIFLQQKYFLIEYARQKKMRELSTTDNRNANASLGFKIPDALAASAA